MEAEKSLKLLLDQQKISAEQLNVSNSPEEVFVELNWPLILRHADEMGNQFLSATAFFDGTPQIPRALAEYIEVSYRLFHGLMDCFRGHLHCSGCPFSTYIDSLIEVVGLEMYELMEHVISTVYGSQQTAELENVISNLTGLRTRLATGPQSDKSAASKLILEWVDSVRETAESQSQQTDLVDTSAPPYEYSMPTDSEVTSSIVAQVQEFLREVSNLVKDVALESAKLERVFELCEELSDSAKGMTDGRSADFKVFEGKSIFRASNSIEMIMSGVNESSGSSSEDGVNESSGSEDDSDSKNERLEIIGMGMRDLIRGIIDTSTESSPAV